MGIKSEVQRGLIYAGETPLALTIAVEQTGPMQVTVRAGRFTSTGQARIRDAALYTEAFLAASKNHDVMPDGRVRAWILDANGPPIDKAKTYVLAADQVIDLTSDPTRPVAYDVDLISDGTQTDVFMKRKVVGVEGYGDPSAGWMKVHELLFEFTLPPGCADITPLDIYVLTVKPGFPAGTGSDDWIMQRGGM